MKKHSAVILLSLLITLIGCSKSQEDIIKNLEAESSKLLIAIHEADPVSAKSAAKALAPTNTDFVNNIEQAVSSQKVMREVAWKEQQRDKPGAYDNPRKYEFKIIKVGHKVIADGIKIYVCGVLNSNQKHNVYGDIGMINNEGNIGGTKDAVEYSLKKEKDGYSFVGATAIDCDNIDKLIADGSPTKKAELTPQTTEITKSTDSPKPSESQTVETKSANSQLQSAKFSASSNVQPYKSLTYVPANAFDGNRETSWCAHGGAGNFIEVEFQSDVKVDSINIVPGYGGKLESFLRNNRVKTGTLTLSNGKSTKIALEDKMEPQSFKINATTNKIRLTVDEVYNGKKDNDTCVSEVSFQ